MFDKTRIYASAGGVAALAMLATSSALAQDTPSPAAPSVSVTRFEVRAIQVRGNRLLPAERVEELVYPYMGPDRSPDDIEAARAALQGEYEARGYSTVSVFIPEQSVESGIILLEVQPQTIGSVEVAGGTRTSRDWVLARAPSLQPGSTPNFTEVQRDIVALNQSADRRVTPEVRAGTAPGTIDVVLNVEDHTPWHASVELNNFSSAATSDLRLSGTLRYDDLWGRGDSLSLSTQIAPERPQDGTVLSVNYLARLGAAQLLGYYVRSDSDIAVIGGTTVVGRGNLAGLRFILPLGNAEGFYHSLTVGADWKDFDEDVTLGPDRDSAPIQYFPFTIGWRGDWTGERLRGNAAFTAIFGFRGLGDGIAAFDNKRFGARPNFFLLRTEAGAVGDYAHDLQISVRATGQWSPDPLISNEGFSLGGMDTVRGYFESEALGDYGLAFQTELRSPDLAPRIGGTFVTQLRLHAFIDTGFAGIHRPLTGQDDDWLFSSAGAGLRLQLMRALNGALDVGVPLRSGPDSDRGDVFARFRIWGEF